MSKIAVAGAGYVGLSIACLLAAKDTVMLVDVVPEKIDAVNAGSSPIEDLDIEERLASGDLDLRATLDGSAAYEAADMVIVAVPTNYDEETNSFDTSLVEDVVGLAFSANPDALVVVKSTIPVGFTERMAQEHLGCRLMFSPEFLREGKALYDNLYPSRIIVGCPERGSATQKDAQRFADLLACAALVEEPPVILMTSTEAEAVKLFANTYLATRVAFFNELDTYAEIKGMDASRLIEGITFDPRIGDTYCNPSFGYGGYCLPKDTKQLLAEFDGVPEAMISSVVAANGIRKTYVAERVKGLLLRKGKTSGVVGAYRLTMKLGSDNFRSAAIRDVIELLRGFGYEVVVYEPTLDRAEYQGLEIVPDLGAFKARSDIIIANRLDACLDDVAEKVYSRDCLKGC